MRALIYGKGMSDKLAMEALLSPLINQKLWEGIQILFLEAPSGHKKQSLLAKVPVRAVDILRNDPNSIVVAIPDLYPKNIEFSHVTPQELIDGIKSIFDRVLQSKNIADERLKKRFHVFCFKYDLEALILAAESELCERLGTASLSITWTIPVEDQNHNLPPKKVVEKLFEDVGKHYKGTVDTPAILGKVDYKTLAQQCPQCFQPFVEFLENLSIL